MDFDTKAAVVADAWLITEKLDNWKDYVKWANLGLPFAYGHTFGYVTLKKDGRKAVEEAYDMLYTVLKLDTDVEYDDFIKMCLDSEVVGA